MSLSAVVPIKCAPSGRGDDLGRLRLLLASLDKFWAGSEKLQVHLICPRDDMVAVAKTVHGRYPRLKKTVHDEIDVVPHLGRGTKAAGWLKQQAIKLCAHNVVASDFMLILDADLFGTRPFDEADLFVGGRALTDHTYRAKFKRWWTFSAEVLRIDPPEGDIGMGVTPQIFSTEICRQLDAHLTRIYGADPYATLLDLDTIFADAQGYNGWTEYTLYSLFAETAGLMARYHLSNTEMSAARLRLGSTASVWDKTALAAWLAKPMKVDPDGFFTVVQSNTLVEPEVVARHICDGLGLTDV